MAFTLLSPASCSLSKSNPFLQFEHALDVAKVTCSGLFHQMALVSQCISSIAAPENAIGHGRLTAQCALIAQAKREKRKQILKVAIGEATLVQ